MNLTKQEFKLLILIHAADADFEIHPDEKEYMIKLSGEDTFNKVIQLYEEDKVGSFSYLIKKMGYFYNLPLDKEKLQKELNDLFYADGKFNDFEKSFKTFIDKF